MPIGKNAIKRVENNGYSKVETSAPDMENSHVIANPDKILYRKLGLDPAVDYSKSAIGILTVSPSETAIIAADIALKSSGAELGFVDRFSGTVIVTGTVSEVEASMEAITEYAKTKLGFSVCELTKT